MAADDRRRYATRRTQTQPTRRSGAQPARRPDYARTRTSRSSANRIGRSPYLEGAAGRGYSMGRARRGGLSPIPFVIAGVIALVAAVLLLRIDVTVNSVPVRTWRWATVKTLLDKGYAEPVPGDLLAVDGSLLEEGAGEVCAAMIDGQPADTSSKLHRGADVTIGDGADKTEEFTSTEQTIPAGRSSADASFDIYWQGSIHLLSDGQDGVLTTKVGSVSGKTVTETTTPAIDAGYQVYTVSTEDKVIALTFDDGPWPETTDAILDILEQYGAKATFFTIGEQIPEYPEQVRRAHQMGCEVLTHSWDHAAGSGQGVNMTYMSAEEQIQELQRGYAAIKDVTGAEPPHVFRAPGGNFYGDLVTNLWPHLDAEIGWDVDTEDWRQPGADAIANMILSAKPGQVVLMHDGGGDRTQTVEALRIALPQLVEQGYTFVTVSELLAYGAPEQA